MGFDTTEMFPSKFLKAEEFREGEERTITVTEVRQEVFGQGGKSETKFVLCSREEKPLVLNKTNASIISKLYGTNTNDWFGKRLTLFAMEVQSFDDIVRSIRVRSRVPQAANPQGAPSEATPGASTRELQTPEPQADDGNYPITPETRAQIVEQAQVLWKEDYIAKLKAFLAPRALPSLSEGVAKSVFKQLQQLTLQPPAPQDDFDDNDPFADTY